MSVDKLAVSFPRPLAARVRERAHRDGATVSGWLADAAERKLLLEAAQAALDEFEAECGPITDEEMDEVRRLWPGD
jgi:hypothetical protein